MNEQGHEAGRPVHSQAEGGLTADRTRRRLTTAGMAGAGVLMAVTSRSALGVSVGGACGSETASAALSRHGEVPRCGCSPGFWWNNNGRRVWADFLEPAYPQFARDAKFNEVFCSGLPPGVKVVFKNGNTTLFDAKKSGGRYPQTNYEKCNDIHAICMHAVAALLNVVFYGDRYPANPPFGNAAGVISAFQSALGDFYPNESRDSLNAFKDRVDVYDGLWCFNGKDWGD